MKDTIPEDLPFLRERVWLLYDGFGVADRDVPMSKVLQERKPVAILDLESMTQTSFQNGKQKQVGGCKKQDDGSLQYAISAWDASRYHILAFGNMSDAKEYLGEHHPDILFSLK